MSGHGLRTGILFLTLLACHLGFLRLASAAAVIVIGSQASFRETLASREVWRYVYLRTGDVMPIVSKRPTTGDVVEIAIDRSLDRQQYRLKTEADNDRKVLRITGGSGVAVLYGAYHFAETLGVRFYLHGDVIPDERLARLTIPDCDETHQPLFELRGLNPWGSHAEGIDLWNTEDWKQVITQMTKLRMNFLGVHSYPEKGGQYDSEPTVWIGLPGDFDGKGRVKQSFSASYFNTLRTQWGYISRPTGEYRFGASLLFERDDWGSNIMFAQCPVPTTPDGCNAVFNRTGEMFGQAFTLARALGVKTCIGTEAPLRIPTPLRKRLVKQGKDPDDPAVIREVYQGMFRRIAATHPLDYYWVWTPEDWLWQGNTGEQTRSFVEDFKLVAQAKQAVNAPFELATCGWVLGPIGDRSAWYRSLPADVHVSALSEAYSGPVDPALEEISGRGKWAIPWMEEDNGILGPQLWVSRVRKDAADALAYGCTGLMGLHWRTRPIGPAISALARAGWTQSGWNSEAGNNPPGVPPTLKFEGPIPPYGKTKAVTTSLDTPITDSDDDPLYQTARHGIRGYRLKIPSGSYRVTLKFCETSAEAAGKRTFDVQLQGRTRVEKLDIFARVGHCSALDLSFDRVKVSDGWLHVGLEPVESVPCISAIVVEGDGFSRKVNCGGSAYKDYEADPPRTKRFNWGPAGTAYEPRGLPCKDFYTDWAPVMFGPEVGPQAAAIFAKLDSRVPLVSAFDGGAGALWPDDRPWGLVADEFEFVDRFEQLRPQVKGAGNLERFDYWLNSFRHLRAQAKVQCVWGRLDAAMKKAQAETDAARRKKLIESEVLPLRREVTREVAEAYRPLLATASTTGGLATVINWEGHVYRRMVKYRDAALAKLVDGPLPPEVASTEYQGSPRLIVPTVRTMLCEGEQLKLKVIVLDNHRPIHATLHWRPMGQGEYRAVELRHEARGVHFVTLNPIQGLGIEYYIRATTAGGSRLVWPATAPRMNQTIVVTPSLISTKLQ